MFHLCRFNVCHVQLYADFMEILSILYSKFVQNLWKIYAGFSLYAAFMQSVCNFYTGFIIFYVCFMYILYLVMQSICKFYTNFMLILCEVKA
jgi:hypothetical protein